MKLKIIVAVSIILLLSVLALVITVDVESIETPSIVIEVDTSGYSISGARGTSLIPMLVEELDKFARPEGVNILVCADTNVPYQDVIETINLLKNNGFDKVGLVAQKE